MMLARSPAKRSPKTPERRKATPEGAPAVEADWTPSSRRRGAPRIPNLQPDYNAAQFEDERDALARLDAAERALAADDAARGAAAETRRVAAVAAAVASDAGGDRGDCDRGDNAGGAARAARGGGRRGPGPARRAGRRRRVAPRRARGRARGAAARRRRGRRARTHCEHLGASAEVLRLLDGAEASSRAATPAVAVERTPERAALAAEVARLAAALAAATDAAAAGGPRGRLRRRRAELAALKAAEAERRAALDGPLSALKPKPAATPAPAAAALERELAGERGGAARRGARAASVAALAAAALRLDGVLAAAAAPAAPDSGGAERSLAAALAANRDAAPERAADRGAQRDAAVRDAAAAALARELDATRERLFDEGARRGALEEELEDVVGQLVEAKVATGGARDASAVKVKSRSPEAAAAAAAAAKAFLGQLDATAAADAAAARAAAAEAGEDNAKLRADLDAERVKRLDAVEALLSEEKKHRAALDRVAALRRSRRGGDDGASVADSRLSSELRRSGAQLAELRRVDGRLRREADLRPFLRYEDTPGTSYEEWRSVRSEPRVAVNFAGVFLLLFALYCLFAACKAAVNVCARRAYEEDEHDRSTWYERERESADEEFGTVELSLRAAARARGAVELQTKRKVADAADEAPADAFSVANPMERTPRTPRTAMAEAADAFSVVNPMARRSTTSV
ncbi:hypothetical protein JL722_11879 [Aureococcus anophagefferens]|nr:hypothetical protein JL722_11879 [Aureococcus anophagefferens]